MPRLLVGAALSFALSLPALAASEAPSFIQSAVPNAQLVGEGRLTYMMMDIYDARLYAPHGHLIKERPLALSLTYLRHFSAERIADRTIEEMRKQGFKDEIVLAAWHNTLRDIFPNVENGITLTGVLLGNGTTVFYRNGIEIGHITDADFGQKFFSIWLSPETSESELRKRLLNVAG